MALSSWTQYGSTESLVITSENARSAPNSLSFESNHSSPPVVLTNGSASDARITCYIKGTSGGSLGEQKVGGAFRVQDKSNFYFAVASYHRDASAHEIGYYENGEKTVLGTPTDFVEVFDNEWTKVTIEAYTNSSGSFQISMDGIGSFAAAHDSPLFSSGEVGLCQLDRPQDTASVDDITIETA